MSLVVPGNWLIYDKDCPFCRNFVQFIHLQKLKNLQLFNGREHPELVAEMRNQGYEINEGMILQLDDRIYFGDEAMFILSNLGSDNVFIDKFLRFFFLNRKRSSIFYPFCVLVRNTTLTVLRIHKIK